MSETVRTRFAPSPTGYLHIGGARTALFNYLLAKHLGGKFVVRIEDTDQTRNIEAADEKLLEDLRWLGLTWDEGPQAGGPHGPYYQSERLELYRDHARRLLDEGNAYYAFDTREDLARMRQDAQARGEKGFRYPRPTTFPSDADAERARAEGRPVVVRFKIPEHDVVVHDQILGDVTIGAAELSDFVIAKSDGWPTYHFAVVVDDAAMQITHVLRGQEHLMNTPNHIALFEAFSYPIPTFAHLPIIFNMKGEKMSKREKYTTIRHKISSLMTDHSRGDEGAARKLAAVADTVGFDVATGDEKQWSADRMAAAKRILEIDVPEIDIHDFRVSGYLPETLANFIALLGWNPGTPQEKFTLEELCGVFGLERVGKTSAKFDRDKLLAFNTAGVAAASAERNLAALRDWLSVNDPGPLTSLDDEMLARLTEMCAGFRTFPDIELKCGALFVPDETLEYDPKAVKKWLLKGEGQGLRVLQDLVERFEGLDDWSPATLDALIRAFAEERKLGLGKIAQPLRVSVTGTTISPQISDTLAVLGRDRTLARIRRLLQVHTPPDQEV